MVGKLLCFLGFHGRDSWVSPTRGGGSWSTHCPRCGCDMTRDAATGRWAVVEMVSQRA